MGEINQIEDSEYKKTTKKMADRLMVIIEEDPNVSVKEMAEKVGLTIEGAKYHIRNMKKQGIIERIGPDKGGYWKVK